MVDFKLKADRIIKERWGIEVEHIWKKRKGSDEKETYENIFYTVLDKGKHIGEIHGFPLTCGGHSWCKHLKYGSRINVGNSVLHDGVQSKDTVLYLGIAVDEPIRLKRLGDSDGVFKISPLAELGWTEADAKRWCIENNLLSPIYQTSNRGGCWFCHNQGLEQLRLLRKNNPKLWEILMKWDSDSPIPFKSDGHTVHDFDKRFCMEEQGKCPLDRRFRWKMIEDLE